MERQPILDVRFFRTDAGTEPVRDWLRALSATDRKLIGEDIKTVQFGWPMGMPLIDHLGGDLWEVRSKLGTRIARTLFVTEGGTLILLHAFIKKQQKTPKPDLDLAKERLKQLRRRK
jgi:phage-related protein